MSFEVLPAPVVVDASAAIEFLQGNESWGTRFDEWSVADRPLLVPPLFLAEVANGQLRGRSVDPQQATEAMHRLVDTGIEITDRGLSGLIEAIGLADQHRLTVYDALYLQLALDVGAELATLDDALRAAAIAEGLEVV